MIGLAILAALAAQTAQTVELASPDDCAVIVAIGKSVADWGPKGPNQPFFIDGPQRDGSTYREDCAWLGVGAPTPASPGSSGFAIDRPVYSSNGKTATAMASVVVPRGPGVAPFTSLQQCGLRKKRGQWRLIACSAGPIT